MNEVGLKNIRKAKQELISSHNAWFDNHSSEELYQRPIHIHRVRRVLELTRPIRGRLLDLGCFDGYLTEKILAQGEKSVIGVDRLKRALERANARGIQTFFHDLDDGELDFEARSFECVVAGGVLNASFDPDAVLADINRVLVKGGKLIITTPNLASFENRIRLVFGRPPLELEARVQEGRGNLRLFTFKTLSKLLNDHGFVVQEMLSSAVFIPLTFLDKIFRLRQKKDFVISSPFLASLFPTLGYHIIVLAKKG